MCHTKAPTGAEFRPEIACWWGREMTEIERESLMMAREGKQSELRAVGAPCLWKRGPRACGKMVERWWLGKTGQEECHK